MTQLLSGGIVNCGYEYQDIGARDLVSLSNPIEWLNFTDIPQSFWDCGDLPYFLPGQKALFRSITKKYQLNNSAWRHRSSDASGHDETGLSFHVFWMVYQIAVDDVALQCILSKSCGLTCIEVSNSTPQKSMLHFCDIFPPTRGVGQN